MKNMNKCQEYNMDKLITKKLFFYNLGTTFDKNNTDLLYDCWNCNGNCCKSDLSNGLWCEDYGIVFNRDYAKNICKNHAKDGVKTSYGYYKEIFVTLPKSEWEDIIQDLQDNYGFDDYRDASINGYIPFEYSELIDDWSSYWEEPTESWYKNNMGLVSHNSIHIKTQDKLNPKTMEFISNVCYGTIEDRNLYFDKNKIEKEISL